MHGNAVCMAMVHAWRWYMHGDDDHAGDLMSALIQSAKYGPLLLEVRMASRALDRHFFAYGQDICIVPQRYAGRDECTPNMW